MGDMSVVENETEKEGQTKSWRLVKEFGIFPGDNGESHHLKKDIFICGEKDGWERKDVGVYRNSLEVTDVHVFMVFNKYLYLI